MESGVFVAEGPTILESPQVSAIHPFENVYLFFLASSFFALVDLLVHSLVLFLVFLQYAIHEYENPNKDSITTLGQ
jgi:hypothetical protein